MREPDTVFFDAHCGLCHGSVRFLLNRDRIASHFRFAPIGGETFNASVPRSLQPTLPDSLIVRTTDGVVLTRSDAVIYLLKQLGGAWKVAASIAQACPRRWRDGIYNWIARMRYRLFGRRGDLCPRLSPALRERFDP